MKNQDVLQMYVNLVPFLAQVCGPGSEIVIHDVTNPTHSIVAIANDNSGRTIGGPMTDLALNIQHKCCYAENDYLTNYIGHTQDGDFLSSTYYIKNNGKLIGLLCINKNMTAVRQTSMALSSLLAQFNLAEPTETSISENLDSPIANVLQNRIADIIAQAGVPPKRMSMEEKIRIVHQLHDDGIMMMKGGVPEIAQQLGVSVPTVYRYLNKSQDEQ